MTLPAILDYDPGHDDAMAILLAARTPPALIGHRFHFIFQNFSRPSASIGDAGCVAAVVDRSGLTTETLPVTIETEGCYTRGQTVVDRRPPDIVQRLGQEVPHSSVAVALDIDVDFYRDLFRHTTAKESRVARG